MGFAARQRGGNNGAGGKGSLWKRINAIRMLKMTKEICRSLAVGRQKGSRSNMFVPLNQEKCTHQGAPSPAQMYTMQPQPSLLREWGVRGSDAVGEEEKM